jgi:DNA repair exonuclease SbcCD ATPase subunit
LFGKPFRNINKPQLINTINEKGSLVEIEFSIGNNFYQVTRGIKPNIFEIKCNQKLLNQDSHSRDYQDFLEKTILQFNFKSFTQVVILGSSTFVPFMQLKDKDRRTIIEDLLDIQIFSKMNTLLKDRVSENKNSIDNLDFDKQKVDHQIEVQNNYINSLKDDNKKSIKDNEQKIKESEDQIYEYSLLNDKHQENVDTTLKYIGDVEKIQSKKKKLDILKEKVQDNIKSKEHEIHFYKQNTDCPTCKQAIDEIFREEKIKEKQDKVSEQTSGLQQLIEEIEGTEQALNTISVYQKEVSNIQSDINKNLQSISALQKYVEKIKEEIDQLSTTDTIQEQNEQLEVYRDKLARLESLLKDEYKTKEMYNVANTILKDSGIKSRIIKTYLPIINKCIQRNLSALDFYISFELDENFNETIRSRYRDDFTYSSFSEGEKMRIDLALLFSWRQVAKIKNSMNTNLLILDEVFDSSLDSNGTEEFLKLINTLDKDINTFVISHKGEVLYDKFRSVIKFEKKNYFSQIT